MGFQQTVNFGQADGVPGTLAYDGPSRVFPWELVSNPALNVVGSSAYTEVSEGVAMAGGTGVFVGLLVNPHVYTLFGTAVLNGALAPSMILPDNAIGELATQGIFFATLLTAANIGDLLCFDTTSGLLSSFAPSTSFAGSNSGTNLTVTGTPGGYLQPGAALGTGFTPGTIILSQTSGTPGGAGVYVVNNSQTVAAGNYVASGLPPTSKSIVPNGKVILRQSAANSIAIVQI